MDTLVLANNYIPVNRVRWRKALGYILKGRAVIVAEYEDRLVNSGNDVFPMPAVVRLINAVKNMFKWSRKVKLNKVNIWLRDQKQCQYCLRKLTQKEMTLDHVHPRSLGGESTWENLVVACYPCNQRKMNKTPAQAGLTLRSKPVRPKSLPGGGFLRAMEEVPESWKDFLGSLAYWEAEITT